MNPDTPDAITPTLLTIVLPSACTPRSATVQAINCESLGESSSFNAHLARLRLRYDHPEAGAPNAAIAHRMIDTALTLDLGALV